MVTLKDRIIAESQRLGIDKIGFTSAEPFSELAAPLEEQVALGHNSGFEHKNIPERIDPSIRQPGAQSIIAIALAYPTKATYEIPRDEKRGQFARASWGRDYHFVLEDKMNQLKAFILAQPEADDWELKPQVDTGELVDVAVAQRAGLGFIGRNGLLITEEFGSFVYLGEIVTNLELAPDTPVPFGCGDCTRCITACPTGALLGDGRMNAKRCLSYQTQTKETMPEEFRKKIRNVIYGCDICQLACPYNKGMDVHHHEEMEPELDEVFPKLQGMLQLSNKEFQQRFGHLAGAWRGKKSLQRNAIIALANVGDRSALPLLQELVETDPRPTIRETAVWSIGRLGRRDKDTWRAFLTERRAVETDAGVMEEIQKVLEEY